MPGYYLLGDRRDRDFRQFQAAFNQENERSKQAAFTWIRVVISILTPSLVLLVGLQENSPNLSTGAVFFLVLSIVSMAVAILCGLYVLGGEAKGHKLLRDDIGESWNQEKQFPTSGTLIGSSYKYFHKVFGWAAISAIISLTIFGVFKYVT